MTESTKEYIGGNFAGELGEVLIRCNNVMYVKAHSTQDNKQESSSNDMQQD